MKILESLLSQCLGHTPSTSKERSVLNSNSDAATSQNLEKEFWQHTWLPQIPQLQNKVKANTGSMSLESSHLRHWRITSPRLDWATERVRSQSAKDSWAWCSVVEHLPRIHEVLNLNTHYWKKPKPKPKPDTNKEMRFTPVLAGFAVRNQWGKFLQLKPKVIFLPQLPKHLVSHQCPRLQGSCGWTSPYTDES